MHQITIKKIYLFAVLGRVLWEGPELRAGKYALAFWREVAAYENQAPPAGEFGNHSAFVHVWDENGQPLSGKQIYTSWGVLLGATDPNGYIEIALSRPNGYDFQVREGTHLTDTTPVLSVERPPSWGHYSFEIGFMFKQNAQNPGSFDTNHLGTINASGADPCQNLSAPHTASLAYYSTAASNYCSDQFALGNWAASHGQTFVANGNRVVAIKAMMAAGFGVSYYWTAQILDGGPNGAPIGPARSTRMLLDSEYYPILAKWGINDVPVTPGHTYYLKITRPNGLNVHRVGRNNYAAGSYHEDGTPATGFELMGLVVCANYTNTGTTGALKGWVQDASGQPLSGAQVSVSNSVWNATTATDGAYVISNLAVGTYTVTASCTGYLAGVNTGVVISAGLVTTSSFALTLQTSNINIITPRLVQLPFETLPPWSSTYDAAWGSVATFATAASGQEGTGLQATRSGPGSSARVWVFTLRTNTPYRLTVWMRCPSYSSAYWAECAYKLGTNTAQNFDSDSATWTMVKKFSDSGVNGNGNQWTSYSATFNTGADPRVSVGFKLGAATSTGPVAQWDQLAIVSLAPPPTNAILTVSRQANQLMLSWLEPTMILESTTNIPGIWAPVPNAISPTVAPTTRAREFFRLRE